MERSFSVKNVFFGLICCYRFFSKQPGENLACERLYLFAKPFVVVSEYVRENDQNKGALFDFHIAHLSFENLQVYIDKTKNKQKEAKILKN